MGPADCLYPSSPRFRKTVLGVVLLGAASACGSPRTGEADEGAPSNALPVFEIEVAGQEVRDDEKISGTLSVIEEHDGTLAGHRSRPVALQTPIGLEYRGQWSLQFPKKSYSIELRDAAGEDASMPLLGMPAESDWVLRAGYYDRTLMRDALGFWLFSEIWGRYAPRFRFVEVYIDGGYEGIYLACEKIKRGKLRVDVPEVAPNASSGDVTGAYIVHIESNSGGEGFETASGREWEYAYPNAAKITEEQRGYLVDFFNRFERAMEMDDDAFGDPATGYSRWFDVAAAVDFALFQELARNTDGYTKSSYYQKLPDRAGGKLLTSPVWDNDLSFGNFANGSEDPEGWLYEFEWNRDVEWWARLWRDSAFRNAARCRWQALREGPLTTATIDVKLDAFSGILAAAQRREDARWQLIGHEESRSAYVGATWEQDVSYLKEWLARRIGWLDTELAGACSPG